MEQITKRNAIVNSVAAIVTTATYIGIMYVLYAYMSTGVVLGAMGMLTLWSACTLKKKTAIPMVVSVILTWLVIILYMR